MSATRQLLESQRDRLIAAIAASQFEPYTLRALEYLRRVKEALRDTPFGIEANRGWYGENGWAPAIEVICDDIEADATREALEPRRRQYRDAA